MKNKRRLTSAYWNVFRNVAEKYPLATSQEKHIITSYIMKKRG